MHPRASDGPVAPGPQSFLARARLQKKRASNEPITFWLDTAIRGKATAVSHSSEAPRASEVVEPGEILAFSTTGFHRCYFAESVPTAAGRWRLLPTMFAEVVAGPDVSVRQNAAQSPRSRALRSRKHATYCAVVCDNGGPSCCMAPHHRT